MQYIIVNSSSFPLTLVVIITIHAGVWWSEVVSNQISTTHTVVVALALPPLSLAQVLYMYMHSAHMSVYAYYIVHVHV